MHSSRMRTVRCSGRLWGGGVLPREDLPRGDVCLGGCLPRGVFAHGVVCLGGVVTGPPGALLFDVKPEIALK